MNNHETVGSSQQQTWDMSNVPFAGEEDNLKKEELRQALKYAPELFSSHSEIFGETGRISDFTNNALHGQNEDILNSIRNLDGGRYKINYGTDDLEKGYTGLGQVSGALDYFDEEYAKSIEDDKTKAFIKTCIAMWPMGNVGSFGIHEFSKSANIDGGTASLVNMIIDRNSMKLVNTRFDRNDENAGKQLLDINKKYLTKLNNGLESGYEEKIARCVCNMQKIVMRCEKEGAKIAKARKANNGQ